MSNILIAVTGGIAAYKVPSIVSILVEEGHDVKVMMTKAAEQFITPLPFSALSHNPVYTEDIRFKADGHIHHIELADWADLIAIAPATYNTISKISHKHADNLVTSTIAAFTKDILIFPAMNVHMWEDLTQAVSVGWEGQIMLYPPAEGKMACGAVGPGKLEDTRGIVTKIIKRADHVERMRENG